MRAKQRLNILYTLWSSSSSMVATSTQVVGVVAVATSRSLSSSLVSCQQCRWWGCRHRCLVVAVSSTRVVGGGGHVAIAIVQVGWLSTLGVVASLSSLRVVVVASSSTLVVVAASSSTQVVVAASLLTLVMVVVASRVVNVGGGGCVIVDTGDGGGRVVVDAGGGGCQVVVDAWCGGGRR